MIFEKIPSNLKLMSIGTNCLFSNIVTYKSPLDRIYIKNTNSLKLLLNKNYIKTFLSENFLNRIDLGWKSKYCFDSDILGFVIGHHNPNDQKFQINHIKRVLNFYKFLNKVYSDENYYFLLSFSRSSKELDNSTLLDEYIRFLNENNLNKKTFVFCEEKYSKNFDNVILINSIDYAESDNYDKWLYQFRKNSDEVSVMFKQQGYDLKLPVF